MPKGVWRIWWQNFRSGIFDAEMVWFQNAFIQMAICLMVQWNVVAEILPKLLLAKTQNSNSPKRIPILMVVSIAKRVGSDAQEARRPGRGHLDDGGLPLRRARPQHRQHRLQHLRHLHYLGGTGAARRPPLHPRRRPRRQEVVLHRLALPLRRRDARVRAHHWQVVRLRRGREAFVGKGTFESIKKDTKATVLKEILIWEKYCLSSRSSTDEKDNI